MIMSPCEQCLQTDGLCASAPQSCPQHESVCPHALQETHLPSELHYPQCSLWHAVQADLFAHIK